MEETDLLNLDIRLLDPLFGAKDKDNANLEKIDFGIFFLDDSDLKIVKIQGGWEIFNRSINSIFGGIYYHAPIIYKLDYHITADILNTRKPQELRFPKAKFLAISNRFVEEYALSRLESDIMSAGEYIRAKQNLLCDDDPTARKLLCSDISYETQKNLVAKLERYVQNAPQLIALPNNPEGIYREVRLDNKFSRCIGNVGHYKKFLEGDNSPNSSLTICDMVVQYSEKEFYIIEIKTGYFKTGTYELHSKHRRKAKHQLVKAALFFKRILVFILLLSELL